MCIKITLVSPQLHTIQIHKNDNLIVQSFKKAGIFLVEVVAFIKAVLVVEG